MLALLGPLALLCVPPLGQAVPRAEGQNGARRGASAPRETQGTGKAKTVRTVIDGTGRRVAVPVRVGRVVSLAPNITEILYALGAGGKIVGITNFAKVPKGSAPKPSVGNPVQPSIENIVSLKPDLVLVSKTINRLDTVESLDRLGIPVYATDTRTVKGMLATIGRVARLIGARQAGEALQAQLERRLDALRARLAGRKPKRVLFVEWEDPLITTGRDTFLADALRWAGAESVVKLRENWPHVSLEEIVHLQPDVLIFPESSGGTAIEIRRALLRRPGWKELKAVQRGRVLVVSDAINRPSPKLVDAIEELARELHPAAFRETGAAEEQGAPKEQVRRSGYAGVRVVRVVSGGARGVDERTGRNACANGGTKERAPVEDAAVRGVAGGEAWRR